MTLPPRSPTKRRAVAILTFLALAGLNRVASARSEAPQLLLASEYRPDASPPLHLPDYWISEKLDGVRARWDGRQLLSRGGHILHAPAWFTEAWPRLTLDGELWGGRGRFEDTAGTVSRLSPDDKAWERLRFMVFDLPDHGGTFSERVAAMVRLGQGQGITQSGAWLGFVEHDRGDTQAALMQRLDTTVRAGGEGLMLHRGEATYQSGRGDDLLKFKPFQDA